MVGRTQNIATRKPRVGDSSTPNGSRETSQDAHALTGMRPLTRLLSAAMLASMATLPSTALAADEHRTEQRREAQNARRYQDSRHHDEHAWNEHEDRAYHMWAEERHRKYGDFDRLRERDRQAYWDWRHTHSDAQLKFDGR